MLPNGGGEQIALQVLTPKKRGEFPDPASTTPNHLQQKQMRLVGPGRQGRAHRAVLVQQGRRRRLINA